MATSGVFSLIGNGIESGIGAYVTQTSAALSSVLVPVVTMAVMLWVLAYGMAVMRGEASEAVPSFAWRAVKLAMILAVALGSGIYQSTVVTDVQNSTATLAQTIALAGDGTCAATTNVTGSSASSVYTALDCYDAQMGAVMNQDMTRATQAGVTDLGAALSYLISALIVGLGGGAFLVVCAFETVLARVFLDLVLAIGPIFIACGAFEPSRRFFDSWVGKVVTYCLLQVLIAAFLGMALSVFSNEMSSLTGLQSLPAGAGSGGTPIYTAVVNAMNANSSSSTNDDQYFITALGMLATGVFLAMLCWQLPSIASALGGGSAISGIGSFAAGMASRAVLGAAGAALAGAARGAKGSSAGGSVSAGNKPGGIGGGTSPGRKPAAGGGGPGAGLKPAYQRAALDHLNRPGADSPSAGWT